MAEDIFKEIDDEVRADRVRALGRRFGAAAAVLVLAAVIGAGVWQYSVYRDRQAASLASTRYFAAMKLADSSRNAAGGTDQSIATQAAAQFEHVIAQAPDGIATLARFRQAQLAWDTGLQSQALATWDAISQDPRADTILRGLGSLLWVQHQVDHGDPAVLKSRLGTLVHGGVPAGGSQTGGSQAPDPWQPMAQELDALIDLRLGHIADAKRKLSLLAEDARVPEGLRSRAGGLNETIDMTKTGG